jgi:threonine/homoserine/homoserine lactone efflux protein
MAGNQGDFSQTQRREAGRTTVETAGAHPGGGPFEERVVVASPGPNVLLVAQTAAGQGRGAAMRVITGIVTGAVVWVVIAVAGASVVLATAGSVLTAFRLASAGVLVALGIRKWAAASRPIEPESVGGQRRDGFLVGFATNITNPKSAIFVAGLFTATLPADPNASLLIAAADVFLVDSLIVNVLYGYAFSLRPVQRRYTRFQQSLDRIGGAVLIAFGLKIATDRRPTRATSFRCEVMTTGRDWSAGYWTSRSQESCRDRRVGSEPKPSLGNYVASHDVIRPFPSCELSAMEEALLWEVGGTGSGVDRARHWNEHTETC